MRRALALSTLGAVVGAELVNATFALSGAWDRPLARRAPIRSLAPGPARGAGRGLRDRVGSGLSRLRALLRKADRPGTAADDPWAGS